MIKKIALLLCITSSLFAKTNWNLYQKKVLSIQSTVPGWCKQEKAKKMMDLIYETKPTTCVEVGVFGGSSLFPTACTLKFLKKGKVYAIDPWENADCLEGYTPQNPNYDWWSKINLDTIYQDFIALLDKYNLNQHTVVMRMSGREALQTFRNKSIDILHIDGNHTEEVALQDAKMYLPKVKKGGYIWFDDANWPTTRKAWEYLSEYCEKDEQRSTTEYLLFKVVR